MIIIVTSLLFPLVIACSDCFSKCSNFDKTECLVDCGCPVFTETRVISGTFEGSEGLIYVANVDSSLIFWLSQTGCSLACSQECSYSYLDLALESCVNKCGCGNLMQKASDKGNNSAFLSMKSFIQLGSIDDSCAEFCKGSGDGCMINCQSRFGEKHDWWYLWLVFPVFAILAFMVLAIIKANKEDDYVLM
ncbi:hypothetical protein SteCoe_16995 [Stentor coeruleus]|uniref:Transmembrane protein n=1 Tax=Stentor coeruleus TaxID=5963 RepID=A0A1R2C006_9CILI|nr:hypothetical protein SteCoe_16995 [Stentor coeruleus]